MPSGYRSLRRRADEFDASGPNAALTSSRVDERLGGTWSSAPNEPLDCQAQHLLSIWSAWPLTLAEHAPWAAAVLVNEFDAGKLEGFTDSLNSASLNTGLLDLSNSTIIESP